MVTHLTLGTLVDKRASLSLFVPAFFATLSGLLFGLRYAASIRLASLDHPSNPSTETANAENVENRQPESAVGETASEVTSRLPIRLRWLADTSNRRKPS